MAIADLRYSNVRDVSKSLHIRSQVQRKAVQILGEAPGCFLDSDLFRQRLIKSLTLKAHSINKINAEIELLVEQKIIVRKSRRRNNETGLNMEVWNLPLEVIRLVREASLNSGASNSECNEERRTFLFVRNVIREHGISRSGISDTALFVLVGRFMAL